MTQRHAPRRAARLDGLDSSGIIQMRREAERLKAINLASGTCELPTPPDVQAAAIQALRDGRNTYSFPEGVPELRRAVTRKLERDHGVVVDPDSQVAVTVGATGAYSAAVMGLLDPGDEILIFEPFYGWHRQTALMAGLKPKLVPLSAPAFRLEEARMNAAVGPRTRAMVLCTPANPTGRVLDADELAMVARFAREHELLVISDEVYEHLCYDGLSHISPQSIAGLAERTLSLGSLSKTFNVTGWRVGYAVGNPEYVRSLCIAHDLLYTCAPTPLQHAGAAALALPPSYYASLREAFQRRRDLLVDALRAAGLEPLRPEGAYYVLADHAKLGGDSSAAAFELLRRVHVACVPSAAFCSPDAGPSARFLRFCFARSDDELAEACQRLRAL